MLTSRGQVPMRVVDDDRKHDRFRGTLQRWSIDAGPLAGTTCDHAFNEDWSLTWRVTTGPCQGRVGRCRQFAVQGVRSQLFIVSFAKGVDETVTATVDFASMRFVGFHLGAGRCDAVSGSIRIL